MANRKDLAIQRCYRLTDDGPLLMLYYYFNNYIFERPEDPMTGPLKSVDNILDYIKQVYGNVAVKENRYILISDIYENKRKELPDDLIFGTEIIDLNTLKNATFNNPYLTFIESDNLKKIAGIVEKPVLFPSGVLLDKSKHFKYTYDKIVDGNPSTAFVENTSNNLFHLFFYFNDLRVIEAFSIINGYAKNNDLYEKNNKIKKINFKFQSDLYNDDTIEELEFLLKEDINPQIFTFKRQEAVKIEMEIISIYDGTEWNDTCLAEIDFFTPEGWIFNP